MKQPYQLFLFIFLGLLVSTTKLAAQPPATGNTFWDNVYFGGNFGLQFGNQTLIDINPLMGYRLTDKLSVGASITYIYYKVTDPYHLSPSYSTDIYGGSIFTRYFLFENLFAHVEGELLNLEVPNLFLNRYVRTDVFGFYVGGGYRQAMGERSSLNILLLYNLNEDRNSPYQNPIIRVGFGFGI
jgi:hypothetical protein